MTKKGAITLIIIVLVLIAGGLGSYYYFFMRPGTVVTEPTGNDTDPFGQSPINPGGQVSGGNNTTPRTEGEPTDLPAYVAKLRQVSNEPVAGAKIFERTVQVGTSSKDKIVQTYIRFVERGTGHIQEASMTSNELIKISNTTIPKMYEAIWGTDSNVLLRYLKDDETIQTYSAVITRSTTTEPAPLDGVFLADNISDIRFSPKSDRIFYMTPAGKGIVGKTNGTGASELYSSPTGEWLIEWPSESVMSLTSKSSAGIAGYSFSLNTKSGGATKTLGPIAGLTTNTSPSGAYILYSESSTGFRTSLFDVKKQTTQQLTVTTLPEKCVWGTSGTSTALYCAVPKTIPNGSYPDAWYQGRVQFADNIWKISPATGIATKIFDPETSNRASLDIINLMLSPKEDVMLFINKKDSMLWSLDLSQ